MKQSSSRIEICIDANDIEKLADFWCLALDYERYDKYGAYVNLAPKPSQVGPIVVLQKVTEKKSVKDRIHLDIYIRNPEVSINKLLVAGAKKGERHLDAEGNWQVMQDPEGNEFCIMPETADSKPDKPNVI